MHPQRTGKPEVREQITQLESRFFWCLLPPELAHHVSFALLWLPRLILVIGGVQLPATGSACPGLLMQRKSPELMLEKGRVRI